MKDKKDVLFLCQYFYPEFVSSALLPFQTAKILVEYGLKVGVLTGMPNEYIKDNKSVSAREVVSDIKIYRKKYFAFDRKKKIDRLFNYFSFLCSVLLSIAKFRKYKLIIVYSNPPLLPIIAVLAKKLFGVKMIFVSYDIYPEGAINTKVISENGVISKIMKWINNLTFKNCSKVIAVSDDMKEFIIKNRNIDESKVSVIHNWVTEKKKEIKTLNNVKLKRIRDNYKLVISYFGNMGIAQDLDTIVETIWHLNNKNVAFVFAGHGNKKDWIIQTINNKKLNNCFVFDYLKGRDFLESLAMTDLFIVSLKKNLGGLAVPSKIYSYYQSGKPVIAIMDEFTDIYKEIRDNKAGIFIKNGDGERLAKKIEYLMHNKSEIYIMKANLQKMVKEKYSPEISLNKYFKVISDVLNGGVNV
ncbi:MAG: glycosyltransferase family 4 protein [Streptococcaceae bacterium]|jgi:glycosyltransferase involved in cell wall biosynthesis|nr:glycosyltransferase family 4 protein [Streptococcaceae bacterium]